MRLETYTETAQQLADDYIARATDVVETDASFRQDNPDMTIKDYALDLIDGDIESATSTQQIEWRRDLKKVRKLIERAVEPKRYIIKEEPEPLYKSGKKYVAYFEDGTPRYLAAETEQAVKTRLLEAEPDAEFVTPPDELLECMICHQKFDHLILGTCESCYKKWTKGRG